MFSGDDIIEEYRYMVHHVVAVVATDFYGADNNISS